VIAVLKMMFAKMKARKELMKAFQLAGIYREHKYGNKTYFIFPKIHAVNFDFDEKKLVYVFTLPNGVNPDKVTENEWLFKQCFGNNIEIDGELKKFTIKVFVAELPRTVRYDYREILPHIEEMKLPIVVGKDLNAKMTAYDMANYPHLLLSGETGSGKSSLLRAVLTTLIQFKDETELRLILGDLKRSEFGIFRNCKCVDGVFIKPKDLFDALKEVRKEMKRRGDLLDKAELTYISELPEKLPYIIVVVDEVALLKKEREIMDILEEISSIGRSLGVFLILSMQRPDHRLLDGKLKNNLTVRISGRQSDANNSKIAGTPGAENIKMADKGRMIFVLEKPKEVQAPLLDVNTAKKILADYKRPEPIEVPQPEPKPESDFEFGVLGDDE
jgi:DNA segregation ATPase FtsK/SpoIIIE, S-DNA-T family